MNLYFVNPISVKPLLIILSVAWSAVKKLLKEKLKMPS